MDRNEGEVSIANEVTIAEDIDRPKTVSLRMLTEETVRDICKLNVSDSQLKFVAPNAVSIAQAHFSDYAWFRGIYADETPVGFVMLDDRPHEPMCFLWRFMVDARYQGCGYGRQAMKLLIEHVKHRSNVQSFLTSVVQADGGPQHFYESLGFKPTGEMVDGEAVLRLALDKSAEPIVLPTEFQPRLVPALLTNDMSATLEFYQDLGFEISACSPDRSAATWAEVKRDSLRLQFHTHAPGSTPSATTCSGTFYLYPTSLSDLVTELDGKVTFARGPAVTEHGHREFAVQDPNGYILTFRETT